MRAVGYDRRMSVTPPYPAVPRVETERLRLRVWRPEDVHELRAAIDKNRAHLAPWMPWANGEAEPIEVHRDRLIQWRKLCDQGLDYIWGVFHPDREEILGSCGLHPRCGEGGLEIGYWIDRDHLRRGLATELASALVRVGMEVAKVGRIEIHTDVDHEISSRIPRRLGFQEEGVLRERIHFPDGKRRDKRIFSLLDREYEGSPANLVPVRVFDSLSRLRELA